MSENNGQSPKTNKVKALFHSAKAMWKTPPKGRFLTLKEMSFFGVYALGVAFMTSAINYVATVLYIPYFYGIDAIHGYIIMAVASFINMCVLPFVANRIERTKSKWGRYKPYILFTLPLYAILAVLVMWIPQMDQESDRIIYAYMTCVPLLITNGFFYNMYQTMPTIITSDTQERADIMTPLGLIFGFAPSILQIVAGPIRSAFLKQGHEYIGIRIIGVISVVLGILCVLCILRVKERVYYIGAEEQKKEKVSFIEASRMLAKNKPLIILTIALVLGSLREFTGQFRMLIIQCRFAENVSTALDISGLPMTIIGFAATVSMVLLPIVTRKMEKRTALILFATLPALCNIILAAVGYERIPVGTTSAIVITIIHFVMQITPVYLLVPIMLGEIADYQQVKTGKRLDGHIQNLLFTVPLLASQVLMILTYFWQKEIGFEQKNYAKEAGVISEALQHTACEWYDIVAIISAVSGLLMAVVLIFYPLSKKKHAECVEELKRISVITNVEGEGDISFSEDVSQEEIENIIAHEQDVEAKDDNTNVNSTNGDTSVEEVDNSPSEPVEDIKVDTTANDSIDDTNADTTSNDSIDDTNADATSSEIDEAKADKQPSDPVGDTKASNETK